MQRIEIKLIAKNNGQIDGVPKNPRQWRKGEVEKLARSIEQTPELFDLRPIIVYDNVDGYVAIGGNMRLEAAKFLKWKDVPCEIVSRETPTAKLKEIVIKDNSAFGEWDMDMLANEWDDLPLGEWGLPLGDWNSEVAETPKVEDDNFDESKETIEPRCKKGDIWQLGEHRLMCGDSTSENDVAVLMNGNRADIAFTSPPYNMQASGISAAFNSKKVKDSYGIKYGTYNEFDDNMSDADYADLLIKALGNCINSADEVLFNIGILKGSKSGIMEMLYAYKDKFADILIWNKENCMPLCLPTQLHMLNHICEPIFCFNENGDRTFSHSQWKLGTMHNRIDTKNAAGNEYSKIHHATFPVELPSYIVSNFSKNSVLDCFGGTGTTLIACEQLGRKCYMMELDPHYCDVIIARWEKLTNKKAVKL